MKHLAIAVAALILISSGIVLLITYLNRHVRRVDKSASEMVRRRFTGRERQPVENLLDRAGIPSRLRPKARRLVEGLALSIDVSPEFIRLEDMVRDLVLVRKDELGPEDRKEWDEAKLDKHVGDRLYVFTEDVFNTLMKAYKMHEWKALWGDLPKSGHPDRESEWIKMIGDMRIKDLIDVFEKDGDAPGH